MSEKIVQFTSKKAVKLETLGIHCWRIICFYFNLGFKN